MSKWAGITWVTFCGVLFSVLGGCCSPTIPDPTVADQPYGAHERQVFDLWKVDSKTPAPLAIYFHGGGFYKGSKEQVRGGLLYEFLQADIAVAACNYRYTTEVSYPGPMTDCARALQYIRYHAAEYNVDPNRIVAIGDSAGGAIALWLAYNNDLAEPEHADPTRRESTALSAVAIIDSPCSLDPRFIRENISGRAYEHPALPLLYGLEPEELDDEGAVLYFESASAINHVTDGDPPTFLFFREPDEDLGEDPNPGDTIYYENYGKAITGFPLPGEGIHHPQFGQLLVAELNESAVESEYHHQDDYSSPENASEQVIQEMINFVLWHTVK